MSDELKERNILKLILIVRFTCATLDVGHPVVARVLSSQVRPCLYVIFHDQLSQEVELALSSENADAWDGMNLLECGPSG
jgi:hypothetical protein